MKETEEEEVETSKIQAVAHVGAVMSGEEEKIEMMLLRESASLVKRRRVPSNHSIVASWLCQYKTCL